MFCYLILYGSYNSKSIDCSKYTTQPSNEILNEIEVNTTNGIIKLISDTRYTLFNTNKYLSTFKYDINNIF